MVAFVVIDLRGLLGCRLSQVLILHGFGDLWVFVGLVVWVCVCLFVCCFVLDLDADFGFGCYG